MKLITFFGASILALSGLFIIPNSASAATAPEAPVTPSDIDPSKPSLSELTAAINRVEQIEKYDLYYDIYTQLSPDSLKSATEFYREYIYLFNLVAKAHELQTNYATTSAEELNDIIAAAKDAEIACGYLFGTIRKNSTANINSPSDTPSSPVSTPNTPVATTPRPTSPITTAVTKTLTSDVNSAIAISKSPSATDHAASSDDKATNGSADEQTPETSDTSSEIPEIPATGEATGEATKSNKHLFITLGVVALACLLIGSMVILNRKKPYRPGRKF